MFVKSKWIVPWAGLEIENGAVRIENGKIANIVTDAGKITGNNVLDLGDVVIIPGLINAHTHLYLTHIQGRFYRPDSFAKWAEAIVRTRSSWDTNTFYESTQSGAEICLRNGITTVGDYTVNEWCIKALLDNPIRKVIYEEIAGLDPFTYDETVRSCVNRIDSFPITDPLAKRGIAPLAPYAASLQLYKALHQVAVKRKLAFSTHASELKDETDFLMTGTGDIQLLLRRLDKLPSRFIPPQLTPVQFLQRAGVLERKNCIVHCNYLSRKDLELLAKSNVVVVYCPKSHMFFRHQPYPLYDLLECKITVALGTDSLASNEDLTILKEINSALIAHPKIEPRAFFKMATINGAKALGLEKVIGELKEGSFADIAAFQFSVPMSRKSIYENLAAGIGICIFSMISGNIVHDIFNLSSSLKSLNSRTGEWKVKSSVSQTN